MRTSDCASLLLRAPLDAERQEGVPTLERAERAASLPMHNRFPTIRGAGEVCYF